MTEPRSSATWRRLVTGPHASWVLFRHDTCVVVTDEPDGAAWDLHDDAIGRLRRLGRAVAGTPSADFGVVPLDGEPGWVVTSDDELVHTYVHPDEVGEHAGEADVGLVGRSKRDRDVTELDVVHVEDKRR